MKKKFIGFLILLVLIIVSLSVSLLIRKDIGFIFTDTVFRLFNNEINEIRELDYFESVEVSVVDILDYKNVSVNDSLMLINTEKPLPKSYEARTVFLQERNVDVNECVEASWDELSRTVLEEFGKTLFISSAYRTQEEQIRIKNEKGDIAQDPGCSEHQTGLAVDVFVEGFSGENITNCPEGRFINESCGDYGFIVRYPLFARLETGIAYEPWHLRYVGYPHSKIISESYISLEKYIESFDYNKWYSYEDYIIIRADNSMVEIPSEYESAIVSFDNTGGVFLTFKI